MDDCIFCKIAQHKEKAWMICETDLSFAFLDIHPMNAYHTLVITKKHYENIFEIPANDLCELMSTLKHVLTYIIKS